MLHIGLVDCAYVATNQYILKPRPFALLMTLMVPAG